MRLGGLGISRRFEVVQRQLATLPNGLREMQQVGDHLLPNFHAAPAHADCRANAAEALVCCEASRPLRTLPSAQLMKAAAPNL